jgi:hypothetical protein
LGSRLKNDLQKINEHYFKLPDEIKEKGLHYFAPHPPVTGNFLTTEIWKKYLNLSLNSDEYHEPRQNKEMVSDMNQLSEAPTLKSSEIDFDINNPDFMMIKHKVDKKKGSWYVLPKDLKC